MKTFILVPFIAIAILSIVNSGCNKEKPVDNLSYINPSPPLTPSLPVAPNTAPNCYAGPDKFVFEPVSSCTLNGVGQDLENNIQIILWSKISGPSSFLIEHPDSLSTKVSNLQIGVYQFELTIIDSIGLYGKDTVKVTVSQMSGNTNEIILENQIWIFPWYNAIEVKNFYSLIPSGSAFRIFIRRDANPDWMEAYPVSYNGTGGPYEYFIETRPDGAGMYNFGSLYIFYYGMDTDDTPDVKIVF